MTCPSSGSWLTTLSRVHLEGLQADYSPPPSAVVKNTWSYSLTPNMSP